MELFFQQTINGLGQGAIIVVFAIGFSLIFSNLGILNVAQGTFASWGAIVAYYVCVDAHLPIWLCAVVGGLAIGGLGVAVDLVCFAPLRRRSTGLFAPLISSIGAWIVLLNIAQIVIGANTNGFPTGAVPKLVFHVFGLYITSMVAIDVAVAVVVAVAMGLLLNRTRFGASVRAIGLDPRTIAIAGINTRVVAVCTAFLAAAMSGLAGVLSGLTDNVITYNFGESLLIVGFAAVVVGGVGSLAGCVLGGFAFGLIQVYSAQYVSSAFSDAITYSVLLLALVVRPRGLFGRTLEARA
jgi:branched-chain amino acid transport system permease protein